MPKLEWTGERLVTSQQESFFVFEHLHRYALAKEISKNKIVLDIACGEGYGSFLISKVASYVYGVDIDEASVTHAKNKYEKANGNICFKNGSTSNIPLEDNSVDVVVSFETIEHHDEHEQMMKEIKRVLKRDGILLISSPDKSYYDQLVSHNPFHIKELSLDEFQQLIKKYFKHCNLYRQRVIAGSLITPFQNNFSGFTTYDGNYSGIESSLKEDGYFNKPYYNLALCSDEQPHVIESASFFSGAKVVTTQNKKNYEKGRKEILNSTSFKLGNRVVTLFSFLRKKKQRG